MRLVPTQALAQPPGHGGYCGRPVQFLTIMWPQNTVLQAEGLKTLCMFAEAPDLIPELLIQWGSSNVGG